MSEEKKVNAMDTEKRQARAVLDQARLDHVRALLAVKEQPGNTAAQQQLRDAVQSGREAWRGYQQAATAGLAAEIEDIVPGTFRD